MNGIRSGLDWTVLLVQGQKGRTRVHKPPVVSLFVSSFYSKGRGRAFFFLFLFRSLLSEQHPAAEERESSPSFPLRGSCTGLDLVS